jgi:hypothetical protein
MAGGGNRATPGVVVRPSHGPRVVAQPPLATGEWLLGYSQSFVAAAQPQAMAATPTYLTFFLILILIFIFK